MIKIYARDTFFREVEYQEAQSFVQENHIHDASYYAGAVISCGLFYNEELLAIAQFCSPRTAAKKKEYTTELLRLCFKENIQIVGGASKLIKNFIKSYSPMDIFTYQDTTGENTEVYEKSGFTLVKANKRKEYLVKDKKTIKRGLPNSAIRKEYFSLAQVAARGPDALIGTSLGEQFHTSGIKKGLRKTNIELFQDLGWHVETTTGDKVYEWFNPGVSFYTYKITATDSDKYYYGVSHIKKPFANISKEDCLNDNYYGSGGKKFLYWKNKHKKTLEKEVLEIFPRRGYAYSSEKDLINDLYETDVLCLNSSPGGVFLGKAYKKSVNFSDCPVHGKKKHVGGKCVSCVSLKSLVVKNCEIHGFTKFKGIYCSKCVSSNNVSFKYCEIHGETKHWLKTCAKCIASSKIHTKYCEVHKLSKHRGNSCIKCVNNKNITIKNCQIHGETKFSGEKCAKCTVAKSFTIKHCEIHGNAKHLGGICVSCKNNSLIAVKECEIHGVVKHYSDVCYVCSHDKSFSVKNCEVHGNSKHQGNNCLRCVSDKKISIKHCEIHGETKHFGDSCGKCNSLKMFNFGTCATHGETKFRKDKCAKCESQRNMTFKECEFHGVVKHRGNSCFSCMSAKTAHNRWHKQKFKEDCLYCNQK